MPNRLPPDASVGADPPLGRRRPPVCPRGVRARRARHRAGRRGRDRCRDRVDVLLERAHAGAVRVGFVREIHHRAQHVPVRVDELELALQLGDLRLQLGALAAFASSEPPLVAAISDWIVARRSSSSRLLSSSDCSFADGSGAFGVSDLGSATQGSALAQRELERERDDAVRGLSVRVEDQQVARLGRRLLLDAEHAIPMTVSSRIRTTCSPLMMAGAVVMRLAVGIICRAPLARRSLFGGCLGRRVLGERPGARIKARHSESVPFSIRHRPAKCHGTRVDTPRRHLQEVAPGQRRSSVEGSRPLATRGGVPLGAPDQRLLCADYPAVLHDGK